MYYSMSDINIKQNLSLVKFVNVVYIPQKYRELRADRLTNLSLDACESQNIFYSRIHKKITNFIKHFSFMKSNKFNIRKKRATKQKVMDCNFLSDTTQLLEIANATPILRFAILKTFTNSKSF